MSDDIDRRKVIAGLALGAGALAGCTGDTSEEDPEDVPTPPEMSFNPDQLDQPIRFIVESLHYQNRVIEQDE